MIDADKLAGLVAAATKGPWTHDNNEGYGQNFIWAGHTPSGSPPVGHVIAETRGDSAEAEANAALIAMAPDLAAEVLRFTAALAERDATIANLTAANGQMVVRVDAARGHVDAFLNVTDNLPVRHFTLEQCQSFGAARAWLAGKAGA